MNVKFPAHPPASLYSDFDVEAVSDTLVAHIAQLETTSPAVMSKIASIQLTIVPVISYRVDAVIIPKS